MDDKCLSPDEIAIVLTSFSTRLASEHHQQAAKIMEGIDGRDVTDMEQILHPGPELRPPPLPPLQKSAPGSAEQGDLRAGGQ